MIPLNAKEGQNINIAGEQVDLSAFPPACLPSEDQKFSDEKGIVAGLFIILLRILQGPDSADRSDNGFH